LAMRVQFFCMPRQANVGKLVAIGLTDKRKGKEQSIWKAG
jgi:hypothetical protein